MAAPIALDVTSLTPSEGSSEVGVTFRPESHLLAAHRPDHTERFELLRYRYDRGHDPRDDRAVDDGTVRPGCSSRTPCPARRPSRSRWTVRRSKPPMAPCSTRQATGTPGSSSTTTFTTVSTAPVPGTTLSGIVADPGP